MDLLVEQFLDDAEAIEAGHLYVEKDQVGVVLADQIDAFEPVFALGHDVHVADIFQQEGKLVAGKLFIVHNDGGQRHSNSWQAHSEYSQWECKVLPRAPDVGRRTSDLGLRTSDPGLRTSDSSRTSDSVKMSDLRCQISSVLRFRPIGPTSEVRRPDPASRSGLARQ